jgi:hypothetical protein
MALLGATHPALDGTTTVVVGRQYRPSRASKRPFGVAMYNGGSMRQAKAAPPHDGTTARCPTISSQFSRLSDGGPRRGRSRRQSFSLRIVTTGEDLFYRLHVVPIHLPAAAIPGNPIATNAPSGRKSRPPPTARASIESPASRRPRPPIAVDRDCTHDSAFRRSPRILMAARQIWSTINACAPVCQPHTIQSALLTRNSQNPALRRAALRDATHHAATTVTNIAGHCTQSRRVTRNSPATRQ